MRYSELSTLMYKSLSCEYTEGAIGALQDLIEDWQQFKRTRLSVHGDIKCNNIEEPYIISAIGLSNTLINSLSGYELTEGMGKVFSRHKMAAISASTLRGDEIWLDGHKLNYDDLVKDVFLSCVAISDDYLVFDFITWNGEPESISVALSSISPAEVRMRDWTTQS